MSGLSLDGTGMTTVMPTTGNSYVGGLSAIRSLSIVDPLGRANPASGLTVRGGGLSVGLSGDSDTNLWAAVVVANGGTVSLARLQIINTFIAAEKAAGTWALTDDYWGLWAENAPQALTSLKQRRLAAAVAAPTFVVDRNYVFNGTSNYLTTGFIPGTHAVAMTGTNLRIAVYERTNLSSNTRAAGVTDSTNSTLSIRPRSGGSCFAETNCGPITYTLPAANSQGYFAASKNGADASTCFGYKNAVSMVQTFSTTFGSILPTREIYIGCYNNAGTAAGFRAASISIVAVSAAFTLAQEQAQRANVQAWGTSVGGAV